MLVEAPIPANVDVVDQEGISMEKFLEPKGIAMVEPEFFSIFDLWFFLHQIMRLTV